MVPQAPPHGTGEQPVEDELATLELATELEEELTALEAALELALETELDETLVLALLADALELLAEGPELLADGPAPEPPWPPAPLPPGPGPAPGPGAPPDPAEVESKGLAKSAPRMSAHPATVPMKARAHAQRVVVVLRCMARIRSSW
jgi:hypothetical protein